MSKIKKIDTEKSEEELKEYINNTSDCFEHKMWHHCINMEFQKIVNFLNRTSDDKD